jgi:hypothetical protein
VYQRELVTSVVSGEGFDDELEHSFWIGKKWKSPALHPTPPKRQHSGKALELTQSTW